jgi:hypothetical protein
MLSQIKNIFIITFFLGGALIVYGNYSGLYIVTAIISVLVMLIYFFISLYLNNKDKQISIEQLGDSNYYLGFLFTLISILFSFLSSVVNMYDIDSILYNFGLSLITTVIGLFSRIYLISFIPTNDANIEMINKSIYDKIRMMDATLMENVQKNREISEMMNTRISIIIGATEAGLKRFKRLLDGDFNDSINIFRASIKETTDDMELSNKKQTEILEDGYKKINQKNDEYKLMLDNLTQEISKLDSKINQNIK